MVKVRLVDMDSTEDKEMSYDEAKSLVAKSLAQGFTVVDTRTGNVIDELTPGIDDIFVISMLDGG